jgi:ribosomal protein L17
MRIHNSEEVLKFWEEIYGTLEPKWKTKFLYHPCMKAILKHQSDNIKVAIRRNKELANVLEDLINQGAKKESFDRKQNPFRESQSDQSLSKIERREKDGSRWGRSF